MTLDAPASSVVAMRTPHPLGQAGGFVGCPGDSGDSGGDDGKNWGDMAKDGKIQ